MQERARYVFCRKLYIFSSNLPYCIEFIGKVADRDDIGVGHDLQSCTTEVRALRVRTPEMGKNIILVDTPGFDDTHKSDYEILELIAKWLKTT